MSMRKFGIVSLVAGHYRRWAFNGLQPVSSKGGILELDSRALDFEARDASSLKLACIIFCLARIELEDQITTDAQCVRGIAEVG